MATGFSAMSAGASLRDFMCLGRRGAGGGAIWDRPRFCACFDASSGRGANSNDHVDQRPQVPS